MRAFNTRRIRLTLLLPLTVVAVFVYGVAGAVTTSLDVKLSSADVRVVAAGDHSSIVVEASDAVAGPVVA